MRGYKDIEDELERLLVEELPKLQIKDVIELHTKGKVCTFVYDRKDKIGLNSFYILICGPHLHLHDRCVKNKNHSNAQRTMGKDNKNNAISHYFIRSLLFDYYCYYYLVIWFLLL